MTVRNRAPVAGADSAATDAGMPVIIAVLANDNDPDGHPLTVSAVTQPANGTAAINADKTHHLHPRSPVSPAATPSPTPSPTAVAASAQGAVTITVRNRSPLAGADKRGDGRQQPRQRSPSSPTTTIPTATR